MSTKPNFIEEFVESLHLSDENSEFSFIVDGSFQILMSASDVIEAIIWLVFKHRWKIIDKIDVSFNIKNFNEKGRSIAIDVKCEDENGIIFNLEMQRASDGINHLHRVDYHASMIKVRYSQAGDENFKEIPRVKIIYLTDFDLFGKSKSIYHVNDVLMETGEIVDMGREFTFVNLKSGDDPKIQKLSRLLKTGIPIVDDFKDPDFSVISEAIYNLRENKGERMKGDLFELFEPYAVKIRAEGINQGHAEGIEQGRAEGISQGRAEGINQGRAEGINQGRAEGIEENALANIRALMTNTGWTIEETMQKMNIHPSLYSIYAEKLARM